MLSFKNVRINQRNLYDYLKSQRDEIEMELKLDKRHRVQEIHEIWNSGSKVIVCGITLNLYDNPKFLTILSIDCNSAVICSDICDGKILLDYYIRIKVQDLFEYDIIDTKGLVYVVHADTSDDSRSAEDAIFGVFSNFERAYRIADEKRLSISARYIDKKKRRSASSATTSRNEQKNELRSKRHS